jgi:uncharacterized protein (DUF952 family)
VSALALPFGIYILAREAEWQQAQALGYWSAPSLLSEGFIHAASHEQVPGVYARHFSDCASVLLLKLDEAALVDYLRWDSHPTRAELFPHLLTPVPLEGVERIIAWPV